MELLVFVKLKSQEDLRGSLILSWWLSCGCSCKKSQMMNALKNMKLNYLNAGSKTHSFGCGHEFESQKCVDGTLGIETCSYHLRSP